MPEYLFPTLSFLIFLLLFCIWTKRDIANFVFKYIFLVMVIFSMLESLDKIGTINLYKERVERKE